MTTPDPPPDPPPITGHNVVDLVAHDIAMHLGLHGPDADAVSFHAVRTVYGLISGELRGRLAVPPPEDVLSVLRAAGLRYAAMLARLLDERDHDDDVPEGKTARQQFPGLMVPPFVGFTFPELVTLHRYRQTTG